MKHLKKFNESVNIDKYKEDIEGILIELKDKGFEFDIGYNDGYWNISILKYKIVTTHVKREEAFKLTDVDEYLMTLVEYFKVYFKVKRIYYKVKLPSDNSKSRTIIHSLNDYINSDSLYNINMIVVIEN